MACLNLGPVEVRLSSDDQGYRTYSVDYKVRGVPGVDGPYSASNAVGLPRVGQTWGLVAAHTGFSGDVDPCAWCRPNFEVKKHPQTKEGERPQYWIVTVTFSSRPQETNQERCTTGNCNPMDEIQKITWSHQDFTEEASHDRFGRRILSSSHEPIHGPNNEWEFTRTTIQFVQNIDDPDQLFIAEQLKDSVNDREFWGLPPRTVKFKPGGLERHIRMTDPLVGTTDPECECYFTRTLLFQIKYRRREGVGAGETTGTGTLGDLLAIPGGPYETWDRDLWDEGTKVLRGRWGDPVGTSEDNWVLIDINGAPPDYRNPQHFIRFKDRNGENQRTLLDGRGRPAFVRSVQNQWWVVREEEGNPFVYPPAKYHKIYTPCAAALKYADDLFISDVGIYDVTIYGPYASEAAADAAIAGAGIGTVGLGPAVTNCDGRPASAGVIHVEKYGQSDFRLLGVTGTLADFTTPLRPFENP